MEWSELYSADNKPTFEDIAQYISSGLWPELNTYLQQTYSTVPKLSYSSCAWQPGWNVKYQKSGKSLCTLYPMQGFFIALVVIGERERAETELSLPLFSEYFRRLYEQTVGGNGQKWLMIHVTSGEVLDDVKRCVGIRRQG